MKTEVYLYTQIWYKDARVDYRCAFENGDGRLEQHGFGTREELVSRLKDNYKQIRIRLEVPEALEEWLANIEEPAFEYREIDINNI